MTICIIENEKSAKEILDDYNRMMEMLKPYLPKIPKYKPKLKTEWRIDNPYILPKKHKCEKTF